jgi:hypothetical protein
VSRTHNKNLEAIQAIESLMTCDLISGATKNYLLEVRDSLLEEVEHEQDERQLA